MKIDVKIKKMERVPWESIQDLQPMDFKNDYHSEKIKQSILKHNYASPIHVWDDNGQLYAVDGHLRMDLLKELKSEGADIPDKLPVVFLDLPDRETAVKYLLEVFNTKSNPINQDSLNQWMEELDVTLEELDVSLDDLHVEIDQEVEYLEEETVGDDDVPDVDNAKTITVKGDLYELGNHRLLCGDSTMIDDIEKLMDGEKADMVFTDPPYGMNAVSNSGVLSKKYKSDILNDDSVNVAKNCFNLCLSLNINKMVFWGANYYSSALPDSSCWLVWDKNNGQSDQMDCELAWTNLKGCTRQYTKASEKTNRVHPTQKPVSLAEWCFEKYDANTVIDLFLGSGSTLIACEKTNRKCYGMELDEKYCDVIVRRWVNFMIENGNEDKIVLKRNGQGIDYRDFFDYE